MGEAGGKSFFDLPIHPRPAYKNRGLGEMSIAELRDYQGASCDVYSRVTGYYRAVRNWNIGKKEEYKERVVFGHDKEEVQEGLRAAGVSRVSSAPLAEDDIIVKSVEEEEVCASCMVPAKDGISAGYIKDTTIPPLRPGQLRRVYG